MQSTVVVLVIIVIVLNAFVIYRMYSNQKAKKKFQKMLLEKCQENKELCEAWSALSKFSKKRFEDFSESEKRYLRIILQEFADDAEFLKLMNRLLYEPDIDKLKDRSLEM